MILVVTLTVRKAKIDKFRLFERHAASVIRKHGGRIERTIVVSSDRASDEQKEVHLVSFPNEQAFTSYRGDAELLELIHLRDEAVVQTEILVGVEGPNYDAM